MNRCPTCGSYYRVETHCQRDGTELEPAEALVDRYQIVDRVGEGGMGAVYKAVHTLLDNRVVAIKLLHRELSQNPEVINRFFREAQAASRVQNEHIIEVVDFGVTDEGDSFLVMEYVEGTSLRDVIDLEGALVLKEALSIGLQIAEGLYAAHRKGIIHRDLKPENALLLGRQGKIFVKLLDFGIAKLTELKDSKLTRAGMVVGTPAYMSPEQAGGESVDHRTDIYALGTILYEMLVGHCPFEGDSAKQVLLSQLTKQPRPPRELRPEIPEPIEAVILRALHKDPDQRPQTMLRLAYELRDALGRRTIVSPAAGIATAALDEAAEEQVPTDAEAGPPAGADDGPEPGTQLEPEPTAELLGRPSLSLRRLLPVVGLGAGLVLGIGLTVLLMSSDGDEGDARAQVAPRDALVVVIHAEAGVVAAPAPPDAGVRRKVRKRGQRRHHARRKPHRRRGAARRHGAAKKKDPAAGAPKGESFARVLSIPAGADVYDGVVRLGKTPLKVDSSRARKLTVHRAGYQERQIRLAGGSTRTVTARLKKATVSWEVMSLRQLERMKNKGQISRFTYKRRKADLLEKRNAKLVRLRVKHKMGQLTEEQYSRAVEAVKESYR